MALLEYEKLTEMFKEKVKEYDCFDFSPYDEVEISRFENCVVDVNQPVDKLDRELFTLIQAVIENRNSSNNFEIYLNNKPQVFFLNKGLYESLMEKCKYSFAQKDMKTFLDQLKEQGVIEAYLILHSKKQIRLFTMLDDSVFQGLAESIRDSFEEEISDCFSTLIYRYNLAYYKPEGLV